MRTQSHTDADVLVIGAGASGGVVARHLARSGVRVVVLEQGDWPDPGRYPGTRPDYELQTLQRFSADPNARASRADYPLDLSDSQGPVVHMYNGVGGSTVMFAAVWVRPTPSDFRVRSMDGIADDWPISYRELAPHFAATDVEFGVSGLGGNPAYPPGDAPPLPSLPIGPTGRKVAEGMNRLGWHWWPANNAIASRAHGDQQLCQRYGTCVAGCPAGAKGSTDVTHWPDAIRHGATLVTEARVREIVLDERGRARGASYIDREGREQFQAASVVVLAANGIGTPRLLLMSQSGRFPNGLANTSDLVGRRLMLHPSASAAGVFDDEFDELGPSGQKIGSMQFYESDAGRGFLRGAYWTMYDGVGPLLHVLRGALGEHGPGASFWGPRFPHAMVEAARHTAMWGIVAEDLPDPENRVTLHPTLTDSDGLPAPKLTYTLAENTRRLIDFHLARARESLDAAGAKRSYVFLRNGPPGHLLGTAKMGSDPGSSVVDRWGRTHDVPNLFIVDGSIFTTGTGVNPTSTIAALAKRTATYLVDNRYEIRGSA